MQNEHNYMANVNMENEHNYMAKHKHTQNFYGKKRWGGGGGG